MFNKIWADVHVQNSSCVDEVGGSKLNKSQYIYVSKIVPQDRQACAMVATELNLDGGEE